MHLGTAPASHDAPATVIPGATLNPDTTVKIVIRHPAYAEVRLALDGHDPARIGTVRQAVAAQGSWCWEHSDGEQSSPIAPTRLAAARALADYHRRHKPPRVRASLRALLDGPPRLRR